MFFFKPIASCVCVGLFFILCWQFFCYKIIINASVRHGADHITSHHCVCRYFCDPQMITDEFINIIILSFFSFECEPFPPFSLLPSGFPLIPLSRSFALTHALHIKCHMITKSLIHTLGWVTVNWTVCARTWLSVQSS